VPSRISDNQRQEIIRLLNEGLPRNAIADEVGVLPSQVSAVAAHLTMRTYAKSARITGQTFPVNPSPAFRSPPDESEANHDSPTRSSRGQKTPTSQPGTPLRVLIGSDTTDGHDVWWCPSPASNTLNPHLLVIGESGSGKTYAVQCICAELVQRNFPVIVIDYGQGFVATAVTPQFSEYANPAELNAARDGIESIRAHDRANDCRRGVRITTFSTAAQNVRFWHKTDIQLSFWG
jgi:hypothetical protein